MTRNFSQPPSRHSMHFNASLSITLTHTHTLSLSLPLHALRRMSTIALWRNSSLRGVRTTAKSKVRVEGARCCVEGGMCTRAHTDIGTLTHTHPLALTHTHSHSHPLDLPSHLCLQLLLTTTGASSATCRAHTQPQPSTLCSACHLCAALCLCLCSVHAHVQVAFKHFFSDVYHLPTPPPAPLCLYLTSPVMNETQNCMAGLCVLKGSCFTTNLVGPLCASPQRIRGNSPRLGRHSTSHQHSRRSSKV